MPAEDVHVARRRGVDRRQQPFRGRFSPAHQQDVRAWRRRCLAVEALGGRAWPCAPRPGAEGAVPPEATRRARLPRLASKTGRAVLQVRVAGKQVDQDVRLRLRGGLAESGGHVAQQPQIVVDHELAGDGHAASVGLQASWTRHSPRGLVWVISPRLGQFFQTAHLTQTDGRGSP